MAPLQALLSRRGIAPRPAPGCLPVAVAVRPARAGFDLLISDAEGRTARRRIARLEAAAMFIESWARTDLEASLPPLPPPPVLLPELARALPDDLGPADGAGAARDVVQRDVVQDENGLAGRLSAVRVSLAHTPGGSLQLATALESGVDGARALWLGAALGLCARIGPVCAGVSAGLSRSADARREELLATIELPLAVGGISIAPRIGLGMGRLHRRDSLEDGEEDGEEEGPRSGDQNGQNDGEGAGEPKHERSERTGESPARPARTTVPEANAGWRAGTLRAHAGVAFFYPLAARTGVEVAVTYAATAIPIGRAPGWTERLTGGEIGLRLGLRHGTP